MESDEAWIPIGEFARRSGVAASALRFYEAEGLIAARRSDGGRRLYRRADLRRVAFVRIAQSVGLSLGGVRSALAALPDARTPTRADWQRLSGQWQPLLDERIATLVRLRERLASCIGCGCLSLKSCALVNPADAVAVRGPGARYLLGDAVPDVSEASGPPAPGVPLSPPPRGRAGAGAARRRRARDRRRPAARASAPAPCRAGRRRRRRARGPPAARVATTPPPRRRR